MEERRKSKRTRTYLGGTLAFSSRCASLDCIVRNLSDTGARVALDGSALLPDEFDFTVTRDDRCFRARLVWRNATEAGLVLLNPSDSSIETLDWAQELHARKSETAKLRQRVSDLSTGF